MKHFVKIRQPKRNPMVIDLGRLISYTIIDESYEEYVKPENPENNVVCMLFDFVSGTQSFSVEMCGANIRDLVHNLRELNNDTPKAWVFDLTDNGNG